MECRFSFFFLSIGDITGRFVGTLIANVGQKGISRSSEPSKGVEIGPKREPLNDKMWESSQIGVGIWRHLAKYTKIEKKLRLWATEKREIVKKTL